jgi:hemoglobin
MSGLKRWGPPLGAACLLVLALTGTYGAQDKQPAHDANALRDGLRDVINSGAELFNKYGDHAGCYRLYQGALLSIKPFLAPAMQKEIDEAIAEAEDLPRYGARAFALRKTIDAIRAQAGAAPPKEKLPPPKEKSPKDIVKEKAEAKDKKGEKKTTLWDRLGGVANVRKVVDDFAKAAAADPKVNITRDGKYKLDEQAVQELEKHLVDFVSAATGGPLPYTGKSMKEVHKGMGITNAEYDAAGRHLKKALEQNGAKADDVAEVMKAVESLRKDIVEKKKPKTDAPKKDVPKADAPKKDDTKNVSTLPVKNNEETAQISGRVRFEGKPAPIGYVTLVSADKRRYSTFINEDGTYAFRTPVPIGSYKVAIERSFGQEAPQPNVPARFRSETTSGLTFEVRPGRGVLVFDVELQK